MSNCTILIQGRLTESTIDFYRENHHGYPVVISTWTTNKIDLSNLPANFKVVLSDEPEKSRDNRNHQIISTLNGLKIVSTTFVIKIRGDEFVSHIPYIVDEMSRQDDKIYVTPVFFRPWTTYRYHISDHLIAGSYDQMMMMFGNAYDMIVNQNCESFANEQLLTLAYLFKKYKGVKFDTIPSDGEVDGRKYMIESFEILDLDKLSPYRFVANCYNTIFTDFIPEKYASISRISMLLNTEEQRVRIETIAKSTREYREQPISIPSTLYNSSTTELTNE